MTIAQTLLPEFDHEAATTRRVLERCADSAFSYKPHEKSFDLGSLASHIANVPGWATMTMNTSELDIAPPGAPPYKEECAASNAALLAKWDQGVAEARAALANASDADYAATWTMLAGGQKMFAMPRIAVIRSFIMNHLVHHRGQLTVYLRMNNIPVPSIYGPSADEGQMAATAAS
ncbi:MAG TPA: damage-inducible protein DinB [Solibacterales bacterium]|nr:damage-inducible protein DinB [Bryobacterales bacterium]